MRKMIRICVIFLSCIILPGIIGGLTNLINSIVSPDYFIKIMHWESIKNIIQTAIAQGIYQGIIQGMFFSLVFSCVYIISNKAELTIVSSIKWILFMWLITIALWVLGGIIAILLSVLSPEFYKKTFIGVPDEFGAMIRYAWVGGSIWGVSFGGILVMIIGTLMFRNNYKQIKDKKY